MIKKTILTLLIFSQSLYSVEVTIEQKISSLYISFFNRAADYEGLQYWKNQAQTAIDNEESTLDVLKELSSGFATNEVFTTTYDGMDNQTFVKAIYKNSLGKEGDATGIAFWTSLLDNDVSRSDMVATFMEGSLTADLDSELFSNLTAEEKRVAQERQDLITNKANAAIKFTMALKSDTNMASYDNVENDPAYRASVKIIEGVTEDLKTLSAIQNYIDSIKEESNPIETILSSLDWNTLLTPTPIPTKITLTSTDVQDGAYLNVKHGANASFSGDSRGKNISPALSWTAISGAKSYAIEMIDLDFRNSPHWVVVNIPNSITTLEQGVSNSYKGMKSLRNDYGVNGYTGPFPPNTHRYQITIYAVNKTNVSTIREAKSNSTVSGKLTVKFKW